MTDSDARHCTRNTTMLDMQVTAADAGEGNPHDGILWILKLRLRLIQKLEMAFLYV